MTTPRPNRPRGGDPELGLRDGGGTTTPCPPGSPEAEAIIARVKATTRNGHWTKGPARKRAKAKAMEAKG